jgi:GntR family transcriptional regulator
MAEPSYRRIAADLKQRIEAGELAAGGRLPTEEQLGEQYGEQYGKLPGQNTKVPVSRNTIREALKWLITRGLVESQSGRGTFVATKIDHQQRFIDGTPSVLSADRNKFLINVGTVPADFPKRDLS